MKKSMIALLTLSAVSLGACTTQQGMFGGAVVGAAVGGVATNSVAGAVIGAGVGALAGAVLIDHANNGWCIYRYHGKNYRERCR